MWSISKLLTYWKKVGFSLGPINITILFFFTKEKEGTLYICIDYRTLNANSIIDAYPIPYIDIILDWFRGSVIFSKIDLAIKFNTKLTTKFR